MLPLILRKREIAPRSLSFIRMSSGVGESLTTPSGSNLDIKVDGAINFTPAEKEFFLKSLDLMLKAVCSQEFRNRALSVNVKETGGMTLVQAYEKVMSGQDAVNRVADFTLNFFVSLYYTRSKTIGYTTMSTARIYCNRYYFSDWMRKKDYASLAGHLFHEYLHCVGFYHRYGHRGTLVYEWGYLVGSIARGMVMGLSAPSLPELKFEAFLASGVGISVSPQTEMGF